jgi:hypothetical protein
VRQAFHYYTSAFNTPYQPMGAGSTVGFYNQDSEVQSWGAAKVEFEPEFPDFGVSAAYSSSLEMQPA